MATYKNISNDWYITVDNGVGTIYVDGNLDVTGNITYVSEIAVNDAFIVVAANNNGTVNDMGLVATKVANSAYAGLRFDVTANAWQISSSVYANGAPISAYANLISGGGNIFAAGTDTEIQYNAGGSFGASASLVYDYGNSTLGLAGDFVLANIDSTPAAPSNAVSLFNKAAGTGGTGVYVIGTSPTIPEDELVSVTKARLMAIIY